MFKYLAFALKLLRISITQIKSPYQRAGPYKHEQPTYTYVLMINSQNCYKLDPLEIPRPKTNTPGISTLVFLGHPWKFHFIFNQPLPVCLELNK